MKKIFCLIAMMMAGTNAHAAGFAQSGHSAAAAGVADAFVATANDASAVVYNPAGIAWLPGVSATVGGTLNYRDSSVKLPGGIAPNTGTEATVGHIYATWAPLDSRWGAGFGFAPLYQINNNWSSAPFGTPAADTTKLMVDHASFDAVYAISSSLAVAAGLDWYLTRATFSQGANNFNNNNFTTFGGHAALMWKPAPAWSVGLTGRSGAKVNVSGLANQKLSIKLPDEVTVGVAHDFADVWRLEVDAKWTRWSALKSMSVTGPAAQPNSLNLRDTLTAMAGLTWTWYPKSQFRIGYAYEQGANKASGFNPIIADQDGHRATLGFGSEIMNMHMDLAYSYTYYSKKTATGTYAGTYRDRRQALVFSVSKTFE
ncbi:Long-chain fatty acid transport protein [Mariprofundus ferrinatatus]|uniref:Long-chain fatty acid transport protein n=1 Tax=Mariprofundus ferrinatatus TaxID=1921087 RepID=A0A2K8L4X2_9PROT|nr:outer membrane protein transport protein [Mariprofundus ferrinatatus]ATX82162.1 Long-chain fatty acid transport protein [Mariprofundus ferrinatatus]